MTTHAPLKGALQPQSLLYFKLMGISEAEAVEIASELTGPPGTRNNRRTHSRVRYMPAPVPCTVIHPAGSVSRLLAQPVNLSSNGVGLLHAGYLHAKTRCTLRLTATDGTTQVVEGEVRWCTHKTKRCHAVGIQFDAPLDIHPFVDAENLAESLAAAQVADPSSLVGRVVAVDDQAIDRDLFALTFAETGIDLTLLRSADDLTQLLATDLVDLLLLDWNLGPGADGLSVLRSIRAGGYSGPIVTVTAESDAVRAAALQAGVDLVVRKPYDPDYLLRVVADALAKVAIPVTTAPLTSNLRPDDRLAKAVPGFLERLKEVCQELLVRIPDGDAAEARGMCQSLRVSATAFGYPLIAEAALRATKALDASQSVAESSQDIRRLVMVARRAA